MLRRIRIIASVALVLALTGVPRAAVAEEIDGVCDLEISLNFTPLVDNITVEAYTDQWISAVGRGFPVPTAESPIQEVQIDFYVNGLPRVYWILWVDDAGEVNADRAHFAWFGWGNRPDAPGVSGEYRATYLGPGEPCTDSVMLSHIGPVPAFPDIATSRFIAEILWLHDAGVVEGCRTDPELFCPHNSITREQMAAFLVRALDLPPTVEDFFVDDDGRPLEWAINRLAAAGIATGCGEGVYCPTGRVTRAEMAAFLVRAFDLPASDVDRFSDDDGDTLEASINALAAAGITNGCRSTDPTRFCPSLYVSRDQMAAFLYRLLS